MSNLAFERTRKSSSPLNLNARHQNNQVPPRAQPNIQVHLLSLLRLLFALLTLSAIGWQLSIHVKLGFSVVNFFSFFTNVSNLLAAAVLLLGAQGFFVSRQRLYASTRVRYISAVNMAVVGIVFAVLLRDVDLGSLLPWVNFVLHYIMPCVALLDWLLAPPSRRLRSADLLSALIFPVLYLAYVVVRGHSMGWYPYPFLNPATVGSYGIVALYSLGIALTFVAVGGSLLFLGNQIGKSQHGV